MAYQGAKFTPFLTNRTEPSMNSTFTPPGWLRAGPNHGDGGAAILIDVVVDAVGPVGRLGVRVDHAGAVSPPLTLPLPLLVRRA